MLQEIIWIIRFDKRAKGTKKVPRSTPIVSRHAGLGPNRLEQMKSVMCGQAKRKAFAKPLVERLPRAPKTACLQDRTKPKSVKQAFGHDL